MSFSISSSTITQTGTDTDLSGLTGLSGVVVVNNGSHKTYHLDGRHLIINGELTIDPQKECLLTEQKYLHIFGTLNFGVTAVIGGVTRYSRALGLILHDSGYARFLVKSGGTLNWNGGAMKLRGGCDFQDGSNVNITNGIIIATGTTSQRIRMNTANCSVDGLSIDGNLRFDVFKTFVSFSGYESSFTTFGAFQKVGSSHGGTDDAYVLTDFDAQGIESANGSFIGSSFSGTKIEFVNMAYNGDFVIAHDGSTSAVTTLYKDVKLKIVDTNISNVVGAKYWTKDTNNGSRKTAGAWRDSTLNPNENFSNDRIYTGTTDSNGEATERLLTRTCYGGTSPGGVYDGNTTIDYRSETTDNTDVFTFRVASYAHTLNSVAPSCIGKGVLEQQVVLFSDVFLTESDKTIVDAYTEIDSPAKFYDRAKAYLVDNYAGESATIVTRSGNEIDLGSYNLVIDATASSAFSLTGTTITIKATTFTGDLTTTGTITLSNGASVVGQYTDSSGTNIVLSWSLTNVEATSRVQLFNTTKAANNPSLEPFVNVKLTGTPTDFTTATGTYTSNDVSEGDNIRIRVTCAAGTTALLPFETNVVATSVGIVARAMQQVDTVYNSNNIDGNNITGVSLTTDTNNVTQIEIEDTTSPYTVSVQQLYNYFAVLQTTEDGINKFYNAITAINQMNYTINTAHVDLKFENIGTTDVNIVGGRISRDNDTTIVYTDPNATGRGTLTHDTGFLLQFIQPQVESALGNSVASATDMATVKADVASIKPNTNLIPALL